MNITVIALGVVVIVLLYFLFKMFYNQVVGIDKKYLHEGSTTIESSKITNNKSTRYNYSTWVYVNTWNNTDPKPLIYKGTTPAINDFGKKLDSGATLIALKRIGSGDFNLIDSKSVEEWIDTIYAS
jgi:hypothetical protein